MLEVIYPAEKAGGHSLLTGHFFLLVFNLTVQIDMQYSREDLMNMGEKVAAYGTSAGRKGCHFLQEKMQ